MGTAKEAVGVQAVPLPSAEVACWVQEMICRVLGEPPGTVHLAYSAAEWNKLKRGGKNSPYDAIRRGEIPIIPGTGRAVRIPAAWVHAQLGQQVFAAAAEPATVQQPEDDEAEEGSEGRIAALASACDRRAKQLLRLPPEVLGKARVKLQPRLSMHDWIATDCHELEKLEDKFAKVLARL